MNNFDKSIDIRFFLRHQYYNISLRERFHEKCICRVTRLKYIENRYFNHITV